MLTGCPSPEPEVVDDPDANVAERCADFAQTDPVETRTVRIGVLDGDACVPLADGDDVEIVLGHQGGYMVVPAFELDGAGLDGDTTCCRVTLRQHAAPELEVEPGLQQYVQFERSVHGNFRSGYVDGFLTFEPDALDGEELELEAQVRGDGFEGEAGVRVIMRGP